MDNNESPWEIMIGLARESIRQKENTRFYLQQVDEVYCSNVAIFIGNLPMNLSERIYEKIITEKLGKRMLWWNILWVIYLFTNFALPPFAAYKYRRMGPIYYEYGSVIITYDNADIAVKAYYMLREETYDDKPLIVLLLPNIYPDNIKQGTRVCLALSMF